MGHYTLLSVLIALVASATAFPVTPATQSHLQAPQSVHTKVLILGGGMAGIKVAHTLHEHGINDFLIIEARHELGGRMMSHAFGAPGKEHTIELGANWISGIQTDQGPTNPIWTLAKRHGLLTHKSSLFESISTFDETGEVNYTDVLEASMDNFDRLVASAGARVPVGLVDATARSGYSLTGFQPETPQEKAAEYFMFDWEFAQTPEESSWLASSWNNNFTFSVSSGGFSEDNFMSIDSRGFKTLIQAEARSFLREEQYLLNSTVQKVEYHADGVSVTLDTGEILRADYAVCTFSLGVLQHKDVLFWPPLPYWKQEAIHSMSMGVYTKVFIQFPRKFWFDTEMAVYADRERGRYPIWQSLDHPGFLPGSGILVATVTGGFSKRIESLPQSQVQAEVLSVLSYMYPNMTIPEPLAFYFKSWNSDPLFRGSYANWPASFLSEHHANLRADVDGRLWFAGEATSKRYFGYLHGAYFEGQDMGKQLANCILSGGCVGLEHVEQVKNVNPYDIF